MEIVFVYKLCGCGFKSRCSYYNENSSRGSVLEVDLEYHKELHELGNDYPLALDKLCLMIK